MSWRVAKTLVKLREQINAFAPNRSKRSDGTIGDPKHQAQGSRSDHNPWIRSGNLGVVTALDITHDPQNNCDCRAIVTSLVNSRDSRIKYIIWQGKIISSVVQPWTWRNSRGHFNHFHLSVKSAPEFYDRTNDWVIKGDGSGQYEAKIQTWLKKRPVQVSELNDDEKKLIPQGKIYPVRKVIGKHHLHSHVELDFNAGKWWIYVPDWDIKP